MHKPNGGTGMDRYLSLLDVWAMSLGVMVGWGAFVMPGTSFLPVAGPLGTVIAMAIGAAVVLIIARNVSFLMNRNPQTGGLYSYTREAFGRDHAFLCSWFLCLSYLTIVFLNASALFVVTRTVFGSALQIGASYTVAGERIYLRELVVTILAVMGVGLMYILAKPALQYIHTALAVILFLSSLLLALVCLPRVPSEAFMRFGFRDIRPAYGVFSLVILSPWAYVGFEVSSFDTAHFRFSVKKTWPIIAAAIIAAGFVYGSMTVVSVSALPEGCASWVDYISRLDEYSGVSSVPVFAAGRAILGKGGLALMVVAALCAILTGIIGGYRATTRVLATMAEDRILSEKFSRTSYSILFVMVLSILISFLGRNTLNWFIDLTAFGAIVCFGYTSAATYRIARGEGRRMMAISALVGTAISAVFGLVQIVPRLAAMEAMGSEAFLMLSLWCLLGFAFYWRTVVRGAQSEYGGMSVSGVVLFSLIIYSALLWVAKMVWEHAGAGHVRSLIVGGGIAALLIIFTGLAIMLYIQNLVRKKHEASEREKIRAVESSLAKSQFLFNMSHDIRTPMNAIIGYTTLARSEKSLPVVRDYLAKIEKSSQHLLALINDVLEMSRIESGKVELSFAPEDLCEIVGGIGELFSAQMKEKRIAFAVHNSQVKNRFVWCDKKNLNRVLLNLLGNAYRFTPEGGEVSLTVWESGGVENGYGSYEMRLQDNGIGMSREFVDKLFTAFERERTATESGVEGTGLGLAITKSIVDLMGGAISVATSPGSGTEFIIRMKMRLAEEQEISRPEAEAGEEPSAQVDFTGKRLLLVEDNMVNMEIAKMILEQLGFEVETAENGQIAVDMVASSEPGRYCAILMDIQMPVMDGYTATRTIRAMEDKALATIPILAMTANAFQEDVEAAREAGMQAHIAKPVDVAILTKELARVLKAE